MRKEHLIEVLCSSQKMKSLKTWKTTQKGDIKTIGIVKKERIIHDATQSDKMLIKSLVM